jgi:hypothetical protein
MLPERYRELLTAYVDGELSTRQRRTLQKLLRRSPEARKLLREMQADSDELRALPPAHLDQDLSDSVLTLIAQRHIQPPRPRVAPPLPLPAVAGSIWPYLAAAAAILLTVAGASYLFFASSFDPVRQTAPITRKDQKPTPQKDEGNGPEDSPRTIVDKTTPNSPDEKPLPKSEEPPSPIVRDKPETPKPMDEPKLPPPIDEAITAPSMELFDLKKADVALPVVLKLNELDQEAKRKKLLDEMQKAPSFRLELPCNNGTKALARVQAACKAENIALLIEQTAQERLKKPAFKTNYVVYLEDVTPEELARWLGRVAAEDHKAEAKKQPDPQLDSLVLTQMTKQDREQLSKLLGVDPATIQPKGPLGTDLGKPLSDRTVEQIAASLAGQGGAPRPDAGKPAAKAPEQIALVLAYNPVRPNPKAPEIKRWLDNRKPPRPGTLQILLVLRSMNS